MVCWPLVIILLLWYSFILNNVNLVSQKIAPVQNIKKTVINEAIECSTY